MRSIDSPYKDSELKHSEIKLTESQVVLGDNDKVKCIFTASCDKHYVKSKMQLLVAKHILSMNNGPNNQNCGYCRRIGYCNISIETRILSSNCPYYYKFSMKSVEKLVVSNPCTNRPELCLLCGNVFWIYNFETHYFNSHP